MEELSIAAFWAALIATGIGVFFYIAYAFGSRVALRQMAANGGAGNGVDEDADTVLDDGCPTAVYTCGGTWLPNPSEPLGGNYAERTIVQAELIQPVVRAP